MEEAMNGDAPTSENVPYESTIEPPAEDLRPRKDSTRGNLPQLKILVKRIGYLFADSTIRSLDNDLLYELESKVASVLLKLRTDIEFRESKQANKEVDMSTLLRFKPREDAELQLSRIFRHDGNSQDQLAVAEAIIEFFRSQGRAHFSMDEALSVVAATDTMAAILGQLDPGKLRIRLGQLFGQQLLRLRSTVDSNRVRTYWIP